MRACLLLVLSLMSGCTLTMNFEECNKDADCPASAGTKLYCTSDHLCVTGTPEALLCNQTYPANPPAGAVPIGTLVRLSEGGGDDLILKGMELAVDQVNMLSGSGHTPIVLHICDTARSPDDALKAVKILTTERQVVAMVGPTSSREVLAVASAAGAAQVPLVSPSATAPAISQLTQQAGFIFRVAPSDALQGKVLAGLVSKPSPKIGLLFVDDAYGNGLQAAFVGAAPAMPSPTKSFAEGMSAPAGTAALGASGLTDLVVIVNVDTSPLVQQLAPLSLSTKILMTDGAKNADLLKLITTTSLPQSHFDRITGTAPMAATSSAAYQGFASAFSGKFGVPPTDDAFSAYAYDAMYTIAIALGNSKGAPTGAQVAAGLRRISGSGALTQVGQSSYLQAVQQMASGKSVPLDGASGPIRFTSTGDRDTSLFEKWTINYSPPGFNSTPAM